MGGPKDDRRPFSASTGMMGSAVFRACPRPGLTTGLPGRELLPIVTRMLQSGGDVSNKLIYIAETDPDGCIAHVWVRLPGARCARCFDPGHHRFDPKVPAEFVGASPMVIMSWLAAEQSILRRPDLYVQPEPPKKCQQVGGGQTMPGGPVSGSGDRPVSGGSRRGPV